MKTVLTLTVLAGAAVASFWSIYGKEPVTACGSQTHSEPAASHTACTIDMDQAQEMSGCCPAPSHEPNAPDNQPAPQVEQTTCPVMGGAINKEISTEHNGVKVYFCCPGCKPEFEKNPEKYVGKLPQFKIAQ